MNNNYNICNQNSKLVPGDLNDIFYCSIFATSFFITLWCFEHALCKFLDRHRHYVRFSWSASVENRDRQLPVVVAVVVIWQWFHSVLEVSVTLPRQISNGLKFDNCPGLWRAASICSIRMMLNSTCYLQISVRLSGVTKWLLCLSVVAIMSYLRSARSTSISCLCNSLGTFESRVVAVARLAAEGIFC